MSDALVSCAAVSLIAVEIKNPQDETQPREIHFKPHFPALFRIGYAIEGALLIRCASVYGSRAVA